MSRRIAVTLVALVAPLLLVLATASPAQARHWNWTQVHGAPLLVLCKFWHPSTPYGSMWEIKAVGINNTAGNATVAVHVRRGGPHGPTVSQWSADLVPDQWSEMGTVLASPLFADTLVTGASTGGGGAGGEYGIQFVSYC